MKRFNKTAVALATAGAMTLAIVPNASAQFDRETEDYTKSTNKEATFGDLGPNATSVPNSPVDSNASTGEGTGYNPDNSGGAGAPATSIDGLREDPNAVGVDRAKDEKGYKRAADSTNDLKPGELPDGGVAGEEKETYVPGNGIPNEPELTPGQAFGQNQNGTQAEGLTKGQIAGIVAGALAGSILLGGIIYKLVKDKNGNPVYVPEAKAGQEPTAADKAASDKLISENADEIKRQTAAAQKNGEEVVQVGDSDAADRGVGAATGNNTIAKGLVGLLIASIMGAAVFAFGRRRLV